MVESEYPGVRLIRNTTNRGFAAANNQALRVAEGCWVLLLNPDTQLLERSVDRAVAFGESKGDVGVVGIQVLVNREAIQPTCFRFPSPLNVFLTMFGLESAFPTSRFFGRRHYGGWKRLTEKDVDVVSGMFMLVRAEAIEEVGLLDEDYFVYGEETDWCYRFWLSGWRCVFSPVAQVIHHDGGGQSTRQERAKMYVQIQKSILIYHRKWLGTLATAETRVTFALSMFLRTVLWSTLYLVRSNRDHAERARMAALALRFHLIGEDPRVGTARLRR